jgi:putative endonuclease
MTTYFLYMLECTNGAYYTGITTDPERRCSEHLAGKGAKYTRAFPPKSMVALWKIGESRSIAQQLEYSIKSLSRADKMKLIHEPEKINELDKSLEPYFEGYVVACLDPHLPA